MTEPTEEQRRAYTDAEIVHNDHIYLNKRHHNAPKDENDDPVGITEDADE